MNTAKSLAKKVNQSTSRANMSGNKCDPNEKNCFTLEELMQFEAARQRALARMPPETDSKPFPEFIPSRIFINHVDTFNGIHYVRCLSGIKKDAENEGEEESEDEEAKTDYSGFDDENEGQTDDKYEDDTSRDSEDKDFALKKRTGGRYEIIGTLEFLNNPKYVKPEEVVELLDNEKRSEFLEKILACGFIVYDVTSALSCHPKQIEEAKWVAESIYKRIENLEKSKPRTFLKYKDRRTFILISTLLTWGKTKPIDPSDPSLPFTERDFRKRKPHPNYRIHCELEKKIIELGKKYPNHLRTMVIGAGIPYGREEDVFHFCFKMAWSDEPHLPIFGKGKNILPVIHIDSLSSILNSVIASFPEKFVYLVATDPQSITQKQVVKLLAKKLGNGKIVAVSKEEALSYPDIKQREYDMLTADINIIPGYLISKPGIVWAFDLPLKENMDRIIIEFKLSRGLLPIKIFVHGPPASGKSILASRLSSYYDIPHLHVKEVIKEAIQNLEDKIQALKDRNAKSENQEKTRSGQDILLEEGEEGVESKERDEDEDEDESNANNIEDLMEKLKEIQENMKNEKNRLDEEYVIKLICDGSRRFFKEKMGSNACQNKGYVIDGYPKTLEATRMLYEPDEGGVENAETESEDQGSVAHLCNMAIMPAFVESLDASDEFLIDRVIRMPEISVQGTHYEESEMCRRLAQFRAWNTEENTPLIFYDELDVHPAIYNVESDSDPEMETTFRAIIARIGPPRNYEKKSSGVEEIIKEQKVEQKQQRSGELRAQREDIKRAIQERRENIEQWMTKKNEELEMEEKALLVMGMPLRHYLMKYIFPTLTRGLVEVARLRPKDPVDFLSEFLFRENPEGKMFQPNFEEREEKLEKAIKEYESSLISKQLSNQKLSSKSYSTEKSAKSDAISKVSSFRCSFLSRSTSGSKKLSKKPSTRSTNKSLKGDSAGDCTCLKSPSMSTCSSDVSGATPISCTCASTDTEDSCTPSEQSDMCKCPC